MDVALDHPELVKILVPVDAWGLFDRLRWHGLTHWFVHSRLNDNLYRWTNSHPSIVRLSLEYSLFGDKSKVDDDLAAEICEAMWELGAGRAFISFQRSEITPTGFTTNLFVRLGEIETPTLLVHGTLDKAVPVEGALVASERIPDCEMYLMEGCKHWPQKERPKEFADALLSFLERRL
ncbi:alpha/beta hydrolase [Slackia exigua]|nr:alpha/beta hydrolase [Slackia exigua]MCK6139752.1 alpha/beta hydrolase [Slackia exigua]